jgi:hypothetical protein
MTKDPDREAERSMDRADEANGEGRDPSADEDAPEGDDAAANDTEAKYGHDESPA